MIERLTPSYAQFARSLADSYPPQSQYLAHHSQPQIEAHCTRDFRTSRQTLMESLLAGQTAHVEYAQSLAFEHFVNLALRAPFEGTGFSVGLSPQSLENSCEDQKGVDLLIKDETNLVYLGIDVKLRKGRSKLHRDGFGWNPKLLSPYIYLSLGDFVVNTREGTQLSVRQWLHDFAIPNIGQSGKIPHWDQFRNYLLARIERSLNGYAEKVNERDEFGNDLGIPTSPTSLEILVEKLAIMHSVFVELRQNFVTA